MVWTAENRVPNWCAWVNLAPPRANWLGCGGVSNGLQRTPMCLLSHLQKAWTKGACIKEIQGGRALRVYQFQSERGGPVELMCA